MEELLRDVRYALRSLSSQPGFSFAAVATLALGIGVNTMMFSVVDGVLLTPLPYRDPDRLVLIRVSTEGRDSLPSLSPPEVLDFRERTDVFESFGSIRDASVALTGDDEPEQLQVGSVTPNFFEVLGVEPLLGRGFLAEDGLQGAQPTVVLSYGLWQRRFGGDPEVLGRSLVLNSQQTTVVGVLPRDLQLLLPREAGLPKHLDAWSPFSFDFRSAPRFRWMRGLGRLKAGVTPEHAGRAADRLADDLIQEYPEYQKQRFEYEVRPLHADLVRDARMPVLLLSGAVAFVMLIACANVASLLLVRSAAREREVATRAALGASRGRIVRQLLTEAVVLASIGGVLGLSVAHWGVDLLVNAAPDVIPRLDAVGLDLRVLAFTTAASVLTVLLFGVAPALRASRSGAGGALRSGSRSSAHATAATLRQGLVVFEVAVSVLLLVGAGLMIRSFSALQQTRPGFDPENLATFQLALPFQRYTTPQDVSGFYRQLAERIESQPGIESLGGSFPLPLSGRFWTNDYAYDAETEARWGSLESDNHIVLPGYFESVGARLLAGRTFTWQDNAEARKVVIVDEQLANAAWPGRDPIGQHLKVLLPRGAREWLEVVGVVEHIRQDHPGVTGREQTYIPEALWPQWGMPLTLRSALPAEQVVSAVRREVQGLDKDLAVFRTRTMRGYFDETVASNRFVMFLMTLFAVLAATLAGIGLYGTIAYAVAQRRREFGIRVALGASPGELQRLVLAQGLLLSAVGIAGGVVASTGLARFANAMLFGVSAVDPATYATMSLAVGALSLLACYLPARRATQLQPGTVLRSE